MIGDIGTFAGLKVDAEGRVTDAGGAPSTACTRWATTPAASWAATIPARASRWARLTFGYIAGRSIAGQLANRKTARAAQAEPRHEPGRQARDARARI